MTRDTLGSPLTLQHLRQWQAPEFWQEFWHVHKLPVAFLADFWGTGGKPSPMYKPVPDDWLVAPAMANRLHGIDTMLLGTDSVSSSVLAGGIEWYPWRGVSALCHLKHTSEGICGRHCAQALTGQKAHGRMHHDHFGLHGHVQHVQIFLYLSQLASSTTTTVQLKSLHVQGKDLPH